MVTILTFSAHADLSAGGNSRVGYDPEFKLQTGRLVHRRRSAGEIYTIAKMSNIPPHLCKKRHKVLPSRLASLIGKHNKQSEPKEMFAFEKGKKTKKQTSLVEDKLSAYRESRMIISDDELDEPEVICCPKCKEIFSINRPPAKPTSALKIPCLKEMDAQQKSATRYWQSYLRSTSNSWINFNTDNVYCY